MRAALAACCLLLGIPSFAQEGEGTVVRVNNAQHTEYRKDKESGNEIMVMTGAVSVSVVRGEVENTITASTIKYDRRTNMLFAQGGVRLVQSGGEGAGQEISAETLLLNTSTLEGIFDNSRVVQMAGGNPDFPADSMLSVSSKVFGRDASGTIAFKNAKLTFCDDPDPHWSIRASRIWLLPGGEFAFVNAVLYVGHVPLVYIPAFYYPKDEVVFNPVFGYDSRKGYYFQTTTYILGRKPLSAYDPPASDDKEELVREGSMYSFMRPTVLHEQRREGLVLHNLDSAYTGSTDDYLKFMLDYYGNFGGMVGLDGVYTSGKYFPDIAGFLKLGFSNTVYYQDEHFSAYASDGLQYYDSGSFLGLDVPFRFGAGLSLTVDEPFNLSVSAPVYSDPYFINDFDQRREYMDWIGFLTSSPEVKDEDIFTDKSQSKVSSFSWDAKLSYSAPVEDVLGPWLSVLSLRELSASVLFSSKQREDGGFYAKPRDWREFTPERMFFYPSQVTPLRFSAEIAGTLYEYPRKTPAAAAGTSALPGIEGLTVPPELDPAASAAKDSDAEKESKESNAIASDGVFSHGVFSPSDLPDLDVVPVPAAVQLEGITYRLGYSLRPQYVSQISYDSHDLSRSSDFRWDHMYSSYYQLQAPLSLDSKLTYRSRFLTVSNSLNFNPLLQDHPNLDGYTNKASRDSVVVSDYDSRKLDLTGVNSIVIRPFLLDPVFGESNLAWDSTVRVLRTKFIGDADNPRWDYLTADLTDDETVTTNVLSATIAARESEHFSQKLTVSAVLPPRDAEYTETLNLSFPYVDLNFSMGVKQEGDSDIWKDEPFQQSASVKLPFGTTFTESFNYNLSGEPEPHPDSLKLALSHMGFQLGYTMQYTYGYDFTPGKGWVRKEKQEFQPYSLSIAYASPRKTFRYWKNRITWAPGLDTSLVYDFIRPENSYFVFMPSLTFRIHEFLDITFSSESRNSVIFRYVQRAAGYGDVIGGEQNPFVDLMDSFAFWDTSLETRKHSGFKLKNLKVSVRHNLCDWDLVSSFMFQPKVVTKPDGASYYSYDPYFSFSITWRPMSGVRTQVVDDYGEFRLNP